jgi:hypothetical protein
MEYLKNLIVLLLVICCTAHSLSAQTGLNPGDGVDVSKQFNARLAEAERYRLNPPILQPDTARRKVNYAISNKSLNVQYLAPKVTPQVLKNEPKDTTYSGFLRIGAGLPKALLLEGGFDAVNNDNLDAGFDFRHYSINNSGNVENQKSADNDAGVYATFHTDKGFSIGGKLHYSRDAVHFYGYNNQSDTLSPPSFSESDVKQRFSVVSGQARVFNNQRTVGNIDYSTSLDFYTMEDLYAARESGLNFVVEGKKWMDGTNPLGIRLQADLTAYRDTGNQSLNNFILTPSYAFHGKNFRALLGANIAAHNEAFHFYPVLEGSFNVVDNLITAFAGVEGGLQKNSFRSLTAYNPFLNSRQPLRNSFFTHYYGGVKGDYLGINYRAQIGYKEVDNLALFLTSQDSIPRFNVLYDSAGIVTLSVELRTQIIQGLEINARFSQHIFNLQNQEKPWHLPSLSLNAGVAYRGLLDGLTLRGELFFQNALPVRAADGTADNLNTLLDLSAAADYRLSSNLGAFVQANNLLNNRYQRWQYYPMVGLNIVAGLRAQF